MRGEQFYNQPRPQFTASLTYWVPSYVTFVQHRHHVFWMDLLIDNFPDKKKLKKEKKTNRVKGNTPSFRHQAVSPTIGAIKNDLRTI